MTDAAQIETLVNELIATGDLWPETVADLQRFAEEARAGTLSPDDADYVVALHGKIVLNVEPPEPPSADEWRERAELAESSANARFEEIRRRFEQKYGPTSNGSETLTRFQVFEDLSAEFDDVAKG